jgi:trehalose synthase
MQKLEDYVPIVGQSTIHELSLLADRLKGKVIQYINSTAVGGGVAEILNRMLPLLQQLGVDARWDVIKGGERFFQVTKKLHNALHGRPQDICQEDIDAFMETSRKNIEEIDTGADIVFVHDPHCARR